ncbi:MAG: queuosine precursor transporter [Rhodospirillales bacterium]
MDRSPALDLAVFAIAMVVIVTASNVLVQHPINAWLTWAAFTYPVSFLITDLCNRRLGPADARRVVCAGFVVAVALSALLATPRIAVASGLAFLVAQLLDVALFHRLRRRTWWIPPLVSSLLGSAVDTALFFAIAFAGSGLPWVTWAIGDFAVKVTMALLLLVPFRSLLRLTAPPPLGASIGDGRCR